MTLRSRKEDFQALPESYKVFHNGISPPIPSSRIFCDPFRTLAYGTDASFYRLVPKIVVKAFTREEVALVLRTAAPLNIPVTFRAAGTSLSGQAVTDSVLVVLAGGWRKRAILDGGEKISLEPGIIGAAANDCLAPYRRKIGPDPASINHAMIGGIAANNASGMCCGTAQNSYRTVESMKILFHDGTLLDTADPESRRSFAASHAELVRELEGIRDEIGGDPVLRERIRHKFRIKNTTGYSLNAFVDYADPIDILLHLMIGSEGTLGFIAEITYRTVEEHEHKASALILFPDIGRACRATARLKTGPVAAVELMDRASLRSVEEQEGMPAYLKGLGDTATGLLVETRSGDAESLARQVEEVGRLLSDLPTVYPVAFTDVKAEYEKLWHVRKGLYPAVGAERKIGTTVIIEDVVFPIEKLADATVELQELMWKHGYKEGIIFGHALEGNLHLVFTQDFSGPRGGGPVPPVHRRHVRDDGEEVRRVPQGGARHGPEHGPVRRDGMGEEGVRADEADQAGVRPERAAEPRRDHQRQSPRAPGRPEAHAGGEPDHRQVHRVRLLRGHVPVQGPHDDAAPADRHPAGDLPAAGRRKRRDRPPPPRIRLPVPGRGDLRDGRIVRHVLPRRDQHGGAHEGAPFPAAKRLRPLRGPVDRRPLRAGHRGSPGGPCRGGSGAGGAGRPRPRGDGAGGEGPFGGPHPPLECLHAESRAGAGAPGHHRRLPPQGGLFPQLRRADHGARPGGPGPARPHRGRPVAAREGRVRNPLPSRPGEPVLRHDVREQGFFRGGRAEARGARGGPPGVQPERGIPGALRHEPVPLHGEEETGPAPADLRAGGVHPRVPARRPGVHENPGDDHGARDVQLDQDGAAGEVPRGGGRMRGDRGGSRTRGVLRRGRRPGLPLPGAQRVGAFLASRGAASRMRIRLFQQPRVRDRALPARRRSVPVHRLPGRPVHGGEAG